MEDVLWLGQAGADEVALVGGKAASLSRLAADHRVPPGFCLTTAAFERAIESGFTAGEPNGHARPLPRVIHERLADAYATLAERCGLAEPSVAVRSSAVDEDGVVTSFAGQYESYLNVRGADAVAEAVVRCCASARSERSLQYRRQHGLALRGTRLGVLVQLLVTSDVSAVVFTAHPVTGSRDVVVVNASWGLGESIVGGTVTPDTFVVHKADLAVVERRIGDKRRMTVSIPGGTREVDVPRLLRGAATLDDPQVLAMARLGLSLEAKAGRPVDVECAYHAGQLYLLQCRPITTI